MNQLRYYMNKAIDLGEPRHPQQVMRELGFKLVHSLPQSICDQGWFTVADNNIKLPDFLETMEYDLEEWGYYEDLKRKEEGRQQEEEDLKIAKYEIPEGWSKTVYKNKRYGMTLGSFKVRDKNDILTQYTVVVTDGKEVKCFDKVSGEFLEIEVNDETN